MTYIRRRDVTDMIPNKFEAIRVLALECRRLNDEMRAREESVDRKITSMAVDRLRDGEITYYDARERREQERAENMISAAEDLLDLGASLDDVEGVEDAGAVEEMAAADGGEGEATPAEASGATDEAAPAGDSEEASAAASEDTAETADKKE